MKFIKLPILLLCIALDANVAAQPDFFTDARVKSLIGKAEFWHRGRLENCGHLSLPDEFGKGYVIWGVADESNADARAVAFKGALDQLKRIHPGKVVFDQQLDLGKQPVLGAISIRGARYRLEEAGCWKRAGRLKLACFIRKIQ